MIKKKKSALERAEIVNRRVRDVLQGVAPRDDSFIPFIIGCDAGTADIMKMVNLNKITDDHLYRVSIYNDGVDVLCFGLESVDSALEGHYDRVDDLPDWVKERLAVLMVLDSTPPTGELVGIGRRISESVFWVYTPTAGKGASASA